MALALEIKAVLDLHSQVRDWEWEWDTNFQNQLMTMVLENLEMKVIVNDTSGIYIYTLPATRGELKISNFDCQPHLSIQRLDNHDDSVLD